MIDNKMQAKLIKHCRSLLLMRRIFKLLLSVEMTRVARCNIVVNIRLSSWLPPETIHWCLETNFR